jgi:hypothetical protein
LNKEEEEEEPKNIPLVKQVKSSQDPKGHYIQCSKI